MVGLYENYYKLSMDPFRLSPDHRFSFGHKSYVKAKAYLEYALQRGEGFIAITGGPGTGKTTLINEVLAGINRASTHVATLSSAHLEGQDLVQMVAASFGLPHKDASKTTLLLDIEAFLKQQSQKGHRAVLIVDEAQGLSAAAIEELRLLANLQYNNRLLLQVFLVGQESLRDRIREPGMEHLNQRIIAASHIDPLNLENVVSYIEHRLVKVGWQGDPEITCDALSLIHKFSGGVPRRINLICSRLFLFGSVEGKHSLSGEDARSVIGDLQEELLVVEGHIDPPQLWMEQGGEESASSLGEIPYALRGYASGGSAQPASVELVEQPTVSEPQARSLGRGARPVETSGKEPGVELDSGNGQETAEQNDDGTAESDVESDFDMEPLPQRVHKRRSSYRWWPGLVFAAVMGTLAIAFSNGVFERDSGDPIAPELTGETGDDSTGEDSVSPPEAVSPVTVTVAGLGETKSASTDEPNEKKLNSSAETVGTITRQSSANVQSAGVTNSDAALQIDAVPQQAEVEVLPAASPDRREQASSVPGSTVEQEHERLKLEARQRFDQQLAQAPAPALSKPSMVTQPAVPAAPRRDPVSVVKPSVPKVPVAPRRDPVSVVKPSAPKIQPPVSVAEVAPPAPKTPVLSRSRVKALILEGRWNSRGKPASLLPSDTTLCKDEIQRIDCWSVPQNVNTKYGEALYKVETTLGDFTDGGAFRLVYRTLVQLQDAERPAAETAAEDDWQISKYSMSCRLMLADRVVCRDQKGITREYQR